MPERVNDMNNAKISLRIFFPFVLAVSRDHAHTPSHAP